MLQNVWSKSTDDVPEIHGSIRQEFAETLRNMSNPTSQGSPQAWVLSGAAGSGKTHLLGQFRRICASQNALFVLVDMTDVCDFWETTLLGYFASLHQVTDATRPQYETVLENLFQQIIPRGDKRALLNWFKRRNIRDLKTDCDDILSALTTKYRNEVNRYSDILRALIALNSSDFAVSSIGSTWLQGAEIEREQKNWLGFVREKEDCRKIVEGIAWLMHFTGPTVVAFDQLDSIATQIRWFEVGGKGNQEDHITPKRILNSIAIGLSALRDATVNARTLIVVTCIEPTWEAMREITMRSYVDRFDRPRCLTGFADSTPVHRLIQNRLDQSFERHRFVPPYPTWPFPADTLNRFATGTPREVLQRCQQHVQKCKSAGKVEEFDWSDYLTSSSREADSPEINVLQALPNVPQELERLDVAFESLRRVVRVQDLIKEDHEDTLFANLLVDSLRIAAAEANLPESIEAIVDTCFSGGATNKPLHARLRLKFTSEGEREEHVCVRAIQKANALAFQCRLQAAMAQSGIDPDLNFRRLVIVGTHEFPKGEKSESLVEDFGNRGGVHLLPDFEELQTLMALVEMSRRHEPLFGEWLRIRRYALGTRFFQIACPRLIELSSSSEPETISGVPSELVAPPDPDSDGGNVTKYGSTNDTDSLNVTNPVENAAIESAPLPKPSARKPSTTPKTVVQNKDNVASDILVGWKPSALREWPEVRLPIAALDKHGVVFAGAGSGKTVLLKRIVEEAALARIPAIVIDCANDLASIGEPPATPPESWKPNDYVLADRLRAEVETVVWTPGRSTGNPLGLPPLPDLPSLVDSVDEFTEAIDMVLESLSESVITGSEEVRQKKKAVVNSALRFLAENGNCSLELLAELLKELPEEATAKISDEKKLATKMSDLLQAQLATNPLLSGSNAKLDPALLFGDDGERAKTRVSVINFLGLPSIESQRQFINQLAMTLFAWIKKNPTPPDRPLRGLLIIDEARDFIPSAKRSACLGSLQRLVAQARKYKLGVIFATQNPKDIDSKIIGQCSTQWHGKMNAPVSISTANEMLQSRGMSGADTGSLPAGMFYVSNADVFEAPSKVRTPMCLSAHTGPWEQEQILEKAQKTRFGEGLQKSVPS